jgi:cytochrome c oxidase accessory protein FixG
MFGNSTKLITYNDLRGENRGARKINQKKPEGKGDCIDCNICVEVCPVGIDIRNGLQYECINCGLCADACDSVMERFNYPKGLIKYQSQIEPKNNWSSHLGYASASAFTLLLIIVWGLTRDSFEVSIIRDRHALYRINSDGNTENTYTVKVLNKTAETQAYSINIDAESNFELYGNKMFLVRTGEHVSNVFSIVAKSLPKNKKVDITFDVTVKKINESMSKKITFYSGNDAW